MKHIKIIIGIIIFVIIVTLGLIIFLLKSSTQENTIPKTPVQQVEDYKDVKDYSSYYTVVNCIEKYLMYEAVDINEKSTIDAEGYVNQSTAESLGITTQEEKKAVLHDMLDLNYLTQNKININLTTGKFRFIPKEMKYNEKENIKNYSVYGTIINTKTNKIQLNKYFIVTIDENNNSFLIAPIPEEKYKNIKDINLDISVDEIKKNNNNSFTKANLKQTDIVQKYLEHYKNNILVNVEEAYISLDEEYRNARFGDIEEFKKYIENNKETLMQATATKYQVKTTDNYTQYTIVDKNDNYYIFRETGVMQYSIILDTYTIELPEFVEKYNTSNEQQKVALNINKFIEAINKKDYKYAYSKLADSFKQNYFKTQESFETYVKNNFYDDNKITFKDFGNQATIYTYKTILTNQATKEQKEQSFVVRLGEGTEFEMSFDTK